nr:hypothetical protein [Neobacillus sp. Marseille-Q6967]
MKKKKDVDIPREEFSIEFGDINGSKLYEVLQTKPNNQKSLKKEK